MGKKTECPVTREQFKEKAQSVNVIIGGAGGTTLKAEPKEFTTGSFGWYLSGRATLLVDGQEVPVQVGANLAIIGSKEAK